MRDLIACLYALLTLRLPNRGRHRAHVPTPAVEHTPTTPYEDFPHIKTSAWARYYGDRPCEFDEHGLALVRPYFIAHERWAERHRQCERRVAAVLAPVGIDYDVALVAA